MSSMNFGPLVSGEDLKRELRARSSRFIYKKVAASKMSLILEKVKLEEEDGWIKDKKNKKSYRLKKEKSADEQLEDELWSIAANMGYDVLGSGRQFTIETKKDPKPRQIDVFAKDDEVALVIECTQAEKPTKKNMSNLIDKISAFQRGISNSIRAKFPDTAKIKPKFVIATRNIEWGEADIEKCRKAKISILTETEIEYYKALVKFLKSAARYQLHAQLFAGIEIPALEKKVPATRGMMGGTYFYNFLIQPDELLKISYVGHKASRTEEAIETYQRMLQPNRMKAIAKYINEGGKFPTNIVLNIKTPRQRSLVFETTSSKNETAFGQLTLPNTFGSAWVIDGQHRLYGYAYRDLTDGPKNDKSVLSVLAFENLPAKNEMDMFIDINSKQVKVQKGLLVELYADLHWNSDSPSERMLALEARVVARLNRQKTSPIQDRVVITGKGKTPDRCLTQTSIADGIAKAQLLGLVKQDIYYPGPLAHHDPSKLDATLVKSTEVIKSVLLLFSEGLPGNWALGDRPGGYLCTNIALRAIFLVLNDVCKHVSQTRHIDLSTLNAEEAFNILREYIDPLVEYFKNASHDEILSFRRIGSSLDAVKRQAMGMNGIIHEHNEAYNPEGLENYMASRTKEGTDKAMILINELQQRMFEHVKASLKEKHGKNGNEWWTEGVPGPVRNSCALRWSEKKQEGNMESYLNLIDYINIANINWDIFRSSFALGEKDDGNKSKCLEWIKKINNIRQKTHHPEKGNLTTDEVVFVETIHGKVIENFPSSSEING